MKSGLLTSSVSDTGNFKGVYSNVMILKRGVGGGGLVCPEFDLAFAQDGRALILFDGESVIHGVGPIKQALSSH